MPIEVRDSGTDKTVQEVWAYDSGTDKDVQEVIVHDSGTDKVAFTASPFPIDFENQDLSDWSLGGGGTIDIDTFSYEGSYALRCNADDNQATAIRTFTKVTPSEISFAMAADAADTSNSNYGYSFGVQLNDDAGRTICNANIDDEGSMSINNEYFQLIQYGSYYHIACKSIDYSGSTFDLYIDGSLKQSNVPFQTSSADNFAKIVCQTTGASETTNKGWADIFETVS